MNLLNNLRLAIAMSCFTLCFNICAAGTDASSAKTNISNPLDSKPSPQAVEKKYRYKIYVYNNFDKPIHLSLESLNDFRKYKFQLPYIIKDNKNHKQVLHVFKPKEIAIIEWETVDSSTKPWQKWPRSFEFKIVIQQLVDAPIIVLPIEHRSQQLPEYLNQIGGYAKDVNDKDYIAASPIARTSSVTYNNPSFVERIIAEMRMPSGKGKFKEIMKVAVTAALFAINKKYGWSPPTVYLAEFGLTIGDLDVD